MSPPSAPPLRIGELLVAGGLITQAQLQTALTAQQIFGGRLGTNLVEHGYVNEVDLARVLSEQLHVPMAQPNDLTAIDARVLAMVPADIATKYSAVPFRHDAARDRLCIAIADPGNLQKVDEIQFVLGKRIDLYISPEVLLAFALERHYGLARSRRYIRMAGVADAEMQLGNDETTQQRAAAPRPLGPRSVGGRSEMLARIVSAQRKAELVTAVCDVLETLSARLVFFAARGGDLVAWESRGLPLPVGSLRQIIVPADAPGALQDTVRSCQNQLLPSVEERSTRALFERALFLDPSRSVALLPLIVNQRAFGLLVLADLDPAPDSGDFELAKELLKRASYKLQIFFLTEHMTASI